jgi:ParB-like chromosome segregation protein Spo0J
MNLVRKAIADLHLDPANARLHPERNRAAIQASLKRFGQQKPIVITPAGMVIAGNGTLEAARAIGWTEIDCVVSDLDGIERTAFGIADNRTSELAAWDDTVLTELLDHLKHEGFDLDDAGFTDAELEAMLKAEQEPEDIEEDEVPEPPADPVTKPGDLWLLGEHRLLCGDSTKAEDVERLMDGAKIVMAFTSPPYASQRKYDESSGFRPIPPDRYVEWFSAIQENVRVHCEKSASWFVNIKEHAADGQRHLYVKDLAIAHVRQWKWMLVDEFCWYKRSLPGQWPDRFRNDWEPVFHFATAKGFVFNPLAVASESDDAFHYIANSGKTAGGNIGIGKEGRNSFTGLARPGNVLEISTRKVPNGIKHEAAFPPDLPAFFIKAYSNDGNSVYDPFLGSGTTLIAAEQLGRKCYGMEISPAYCDVIVNRWEALTGKKAVLGSVDE